MPGTGIFTVRKHGITALQISNLNAFIHRLAEGWLPLRPCKEKEKDSAKILMNYLLKKIGGTLHMATTKTFPIHEDVEGALAYIANPEKTDNGRLVYAFGCSEKPSRAAKDFAEIRSRRSTVLAQHFIVSFKPGEITPERALEVGKEICQIFLDDQYQFLLTVHVDKQHTHLHCVFNNTNLLNGYTFQTLNNQCCFPSRSSALQR